MSRTPSDSGGSAEPPSAIARRGWQEATSPRAGADALGAIPHSFHKLQFHKLPGWQCQLAKIVLRNVIEHHLFGHNADADLYFLVQLP